MKRCRTVGVLSILLVVALLVQGVAPAAWAGGLWMYERGTPEVGTANAGVAARAEDASIAASNPAGMSRLDKAEIMIGIQPVITDVKFQPGPGTTTTGPAGDGGVVLPTAGLYYVQPLGKDWRFGLSVGSYMGLGVKYEDNWVGRYYVQESALITLDVMPTISYRVNDWLSIGAGPVFQYAYLKTTVAVNNVLPLGAPDGQLEYKADSFGFGGGGGILVEPWKGTRFGLTYMSPIEQDVQGSAHLLEPRPRQCQPGRPAGRGEDQDDHPPGRHVQRLLSGDREIGGDGQPGVAELVPVRLHADQRQQHRGRHGQCDQGCAV